MNSSTLKTINDKKFTDVFIEVTHNESLAAPGNRELRLFRLRTILDNNFVMDGLNAFITRNIGNYVFSRARIERFRSDGEEMAVGLEAVKLMKKARAADRSETGDELGEILVYAFLESVLDAPKIYSKAELSRNRRNQPSTCKTIHLKEFPQSSSAMNCEIVFGTSSLTGDLGLAIEEAFRQVERINAQSKDEIRLVDAAVFDLPANDPVVNTIQQAITPKSGMSVNRSTAYGIILGYTIGLNKERPDYCDAVEPKMEADIRRFAPEIQSRIQKLGLQNRSFYIYIIPFDDVETDKRSTMADVMLEGD